MDRIRAARLALELLAVALLPGCTPNIGDKCVLSTDCSLRGDRVCDNAQPNGYCTIFNCSTNSCPDNTACVLFHASVPGCPYDDYQSPSRTGRTFCMAHCQQDSDCRQAEGYVCADATQPPWAAVIVDTQWQRVCVVKPDYQVGASAASFADAAVCGYAARDAATDAGVVLANADSAADAPADAPEGGAASDAPVDAFPDAPADATADAARDAATDAISDAAAVADAGAADAPDGG